MRGTDGKVTVIERQSGKKLVIAGDFRRVNGVLRNGIARLGSDGSLDSSFDARAGADGLIRSLAILEDGRMLVGGEFSQWNGSPAPRHLVQLNADGSRDLSFREGEAWPGNIRQILVRPDRRILLMEIRGDADAAKPALELLSAEGAQVPGWPVALSAGATLNRMTPTPDGRVLVVGRFQSVQGVPLINLIALDSQGKIDPGFKIPESADASELLSVAVASSGTIALGGVVTNLNPVRFFVTRKSDGQRDNPLETAVSNRVYDPIFHLSFEDDGSLLVTHGNLFPGPFESGFTDRFDIGGSIFSLRGNPVLTGAPPLASQNGQILVATLGAVGLESDRWQWIARFKPDGTLDETFAPGQKLDGRLPSVIRKLARFPDGDLAFFGGRHQETFRGQSVGRQDLIRTGALTFRSVHHSTCSAEVV